MAKFRQIRSHWVWPIPHYLKCCWVKWGSSSDKLNSSNLVSWSSWLWIEISITALGLELESRDLCAYKGLPHSPRTVYAGLLLPIVLIAVFGATSNMLYDVIIDLCAYRGLPLSPRTVYAGLLLPIVLIAAFAVTSNMLYDLIIDNSALDETCR